MAMAFDSKFIDTSCVLKHNVDELLVGLTKQILLRQAQDITRSREKVSNYVFFIYRVLGPISFIFICEFWLNIQYYSRLVHSQKYFHFNWRC